jgi:maltose alpha-D-glucosyltransferase/alpha-amylase
MMRSFSYAAYTALMRFTETKMEDYEKLKQWSICWERWVCGVFLTEYFSMVADAKFIPTDPDRIEKFINLYLAGQMFSELKFELSSRQDWLGAPLEGLISLQARPIQPKEEPQEDKEDYD